MNALLPNLVVVKSVTLFKKIETREKLLVQSGGVQERLADLRVHLREHSSRNWGPMGKGDLSFLYFSFFCHLEDLSFKRSLTWRTGFATVTNVRSRTQASLSTSLSPKFTVPKKQGKWEFNIFWPHQRIEIFRDKSNIALNKLLPDIASRRAGTHQTTRRKEDNCAK